MRKRDREIKKNKTEKLKTTRKMRLGTEKCFFFVVVVFQKEREITSYLKALNTKQSQNTYENTIFSHECVCFFSGISSSVLFKFSS